MVRLLRAPSRIGAAPRRITQPVKTALAFYRSPEWIALRSSRIGDPDWLAARKRGKPGERMILDHVIEMKDGGPPLDPRNTKWLTHSEHQAKTEQTKRRRAGLA